MSTQNARDTHFFLAGWNGHLENPNATTHFQQAMKSAPTPTAPSAAEPTTRSDAETLARAETTARFLLGWKYGQMPTSPDTLLRQSARVKAKWAWNAACKLLRFIDGSAPAEVPTATSEPAGPATPAAQAQDLQRVGFTHAELLELRRAADDFAEGIDTDVDHDLLARGAIANYLHCEQFTVMDSDALNAAIAAQEALL
ncbi:hypothetical protein [Comamonas terrigena]|uniref:hypothetical protein n=1 Tax=Comamonas terrigena TaxID=32013 RepID=UPI0028A7FD78|nr:hypothetical protein [Comamonas terrigena]